jgi:predicted GH43/DUF377 family glycosyl hydrolase
VNGFTVHTLCQPEPALRLPETELPARAYNPSLAWHGGDLALAYRLSTMTRCGRRPVDFERHYSGELPPIVNAAGVARIDPVTAGIRDWKVVNLPPPRDCSWTIGFEDPRIFSFSGSLFLLASYRNSNCVFALSLIELNEHLEPIRATRVETDFDAGCHQKNWNPFVWQDQVFFVTSIAPHQVAAIDLRTGKATRVHDTRTDAFSALEADHVLRGGAGYVRCGDRYVGVCRSVLKQDPALNTNEYQCVVYAFEAAPPFRVTGRSEPFLIGAPGGRSPIQMATGLVEANGEFLIGYGENDCDLKIGRIRKERLLEQMLP